jgi:hypothetical protein
MRTILRRIEKLEVVRSEAAQTALYVFVQRAGFKVALDGPRCVEILREAVSVIG